MASIVLVSHAMLADFLIAIFCIVFSATPVEEEESAEAEAEPETADVTDKRDGGAGTPAKEPKSEL